ncbi:MAG TPA: hypothetical protein VEZ12_16375, partial [Herpetosiphonaceae bacterium]|nr:hypothetical protein [Herpetosiphonaceae bacterium]
MNTLEASKRRGWRVGLWPSGGMGATGLPLHHRGIVVHLLLMGLVVAVSLGATRATVLYLARIQPLRLEP